MYQFKEVTLKNASKERKVLVIEFSDPKMAIVGEFLMADAPLIEGEILQKIEAVLAGDKVMVQSTGNRCALEIKADMTIISDLFEGMDGVDSYPTFQIETEILRELIIIWFDRLAAFKKLHN